MDLTVYGPGNTLFYKMCGAGGISPHSPCPPQGATMAATPARAGRGSHRPPPPASSWLAAVGRSADEALGDWWLGSVFWRAGGSARLPRFVLREPCPGWSALGVSPLQPFTGGSPGPAAAVALWVPAARKEQLSCQVVKRKKKKKRPESRSRGECTRRIANRAWTCSIEVLQKAESYWGCLVRREVWRCLLLCLVAHLEEELDRAGQASLALPLKDLLFKEERCMFSVGFVSFSFYSLPSAVSNL